MVADRRRAFLLGAAAALVTAAAASQAVLAKSGSPAHATDVASLTTVAAGPCNGRVNHVPGGPDGTGTCWPGPGNTGVPTGTSLTDYNGPCTITTPNAVIDSKMVNCGLIIQAANVTIRKSKVNGIVLLDVDRPGSSAWTLKLEDSEVAMIMGHEMTHALRDHARAQMGKQVATQGLIGLGAALLGLGAGGRQLAGMGGQLLSLKYSRDDETEADLIGLELAARAGYDPNSAISLWTKMNQVASGSPPGFLSDHPSNPDRMGNIQRNIPNVIGLYERAPKPDRKFGPPGIASPGRSEAPNP